MLGALQYNHIWWSLAFAKRCQKPSFGSHVSSPAKSHACTLRHLLVLIYFAGPSLLQGSHDCPSASWLVFCMNATLGFQKAFRSGRPYLSCSQAKCMFSHQTLLAQSYCLSSLLYQEQYVLGLIAAAIASLMQAWTMPYINGDQ